MEDKALDVLCDPKTHKPLRQQGLLLETEDGRTFPLQNNIPIFLKPEDVVGLNLKYQRMYDNIARFYDVATKIYQLVRPQVIAERKQLFKDLVIKPGMKVLETSIGTGYNITFFTKLAEYYGIDISIGMLHVCLRQNKKWGYKLHLAQANAEALPLKDALFDVVYHVGGINFFNDIPRAISEMIRVAKPGAQLLICDETQEHVDRWYKRIPFVGRFFRNAKPVAAPMECIPKGMKDVKLSYVWYGRLYVITFRKPE